MHKCDSLYENAKSKRTWTTYLSHKWLVSRVKPMSNQFSFEPMELDGLFQHSHLPFIPISNNESPVAAAAAAVAAAAPEVISPMASSRGPLPPIQIQTGLNAVGPSTSQRLETPTTPTTPRMIFCPVVGCKESLTSSNKIFRDFKAIKNHLNDHCTGHISGDIPVDFLTKNKYSQCSVCNKLVHTKFGANCLRCRPTARLRDQVNSMRGNSHVSGTVPISVNQERHTQNQGDLPSLSEIHERFVPTIKNICLGLRRLWAQCLLKTIAQAVWTNSVADWTALQMLPKSTLCRQTRAGRSHRSQRIEWTRRRLQRWLAGERASLWQDLPNFRQPQRKEHTGESVKAHQQQRCIALTSEGGFSNACKALTSSPPPGQSAEVIAQLKEKHPPSSQPIDLSTAGNANISLVPQIDTASVEKSIRSFHRLSGGGPSGLRPIYLQNCLSTEHRDEIVQQCTYLVNLLAKGDAPPCLVPFLAGGNLTGQGYTPYCCRRSMEKAHC